MFAGIASWITPADTSDSQEIGGFYFIRFAVMWTSCVEDTCAINSSAISVLFKQERAESEKN